MSIFSDSEIVHFDDSGLHLPLERDIHRLVSRVRQLQRVVEAVAGQKIEIVAALDCLEYVLALQVVEEPLSEVSVRFHFENQLFMLVGVDYLFVVRVNVDLHFFGDFVRHVEVSDVAIGILKYALPLIQLESIEDDNLILMPLFAGHQALLMSQRGFVDFFENLFVLVDDDVFLLRVVVEIPDVNATLLLIGAVADQLRTGFIKLDLGDVRLGLFELNVAAFADLALFSEVVAVEVGDYFLAVANVEVVGFSLPLGSRENGQKVAIGREDHGPAGGAIEYDFTRLRDLLVLVLELTQDKIPFVLFEHLPVRSLDRLRIVQKMHADVGFLRWKCVFDELVHFDFAIAVAVVVLSQGDLRIKNVLCR